jgi:hypothetical protein
MFSLGFIQYCQGRPIPTYAYWAGGRDGHGTYRDEQTLSFSSGTIVAYQATFLSNVRQNFAAVSDGIAYGYFAGGSSSAGDSIFLNSTDRVVFSTGVASLNTASNLSVAKGYMAGVSDGHAYGYFLGGDQTAFPYYLQTTDRIVFSSGITTANTVSNLSASKYGQVGVSDGYSNGYIAGGYSGAWIATADQIVFSSGVTSSYASANLSLARTNLGGVSDGTLYGYMVGGYDGTNYRVEADRITFSTGVTSANSVSNLTVARSSLSAVGDGATYGYFGGGWTPGYLSSVERLVFSTGVTSPNAASSLLFAISSQAALGDYSWY